ncbi:MAG: UPF0175 family protein [Planctomycetota bacterium]
MGIAFDLPSEVEQRLRREVPNLDQAAKEQFVIANYREGKLSIGQVARVLGFETRFQAEAWLAQRGVTMNYSLEDLQADRVTLSKLGDAH